MRGQARRNSAIAGAGGQWHVELGAGGRAAAALGRRPGARIERLATLVQVGDDDLRVVLEGVEHAVAVVRVDVDVGDAPEAVTPPQRLDDHAAVVEDAEARGAVARGVVQATDRHEGAAPRSGHDPISRAQARADDGGGGLVHTAKARGVAGIEHAAAELGTALHELDVSTAVEQLQLSDAGRRRVEHRHARAQCALLEVAQEGAIAIGTERVPAREAITSQPLAHGHSRLRDLVYGRLPGAAD